ncbi:MAG: replication initiation protein [Lachnospiraceae bacterium]|nr:replication initiation protein [Lachnospiraceae bacterium]
MGTYSNEPLQNLSVRKSNDFISAKYKSSLLENQIMAIALSRIEVNATGRDTTLEARLYPGELKKLVSDPTHIYRDLKKLSKTITGHTMFLEDGKGNFSAFSVVPNADYIDGVFIIKFNDVLRDHVLKLEKNYTSLELSVMTDFKKNASFRLYEVLKKEAYRIPDAEGASIDVEYNISELRFIIGLANSDDEDVKHAVSNGVSDWDELYDRLDKKDKKYEEWRDFHRRILKPAQEELEEKSDIRFDFEGIREGRKCRRVRFTIYRNVPKNPEVIDERQRIIEANAKENRQLEIPMDTLPELYDEFVGHNGLAKEDIDLLVSKAAGDQVRVKRAIRLADEQDNISNYMGWLVRAIEHNYTTTETISGSAQRADLVRSLRESYEKNKGDIVNRAWERAKGNEDFPDFIAMVEDKGLSQDLLESVYSISDILQMYADWKSGRPVEF